MSVREVNKIMAAKIFIDGAAGTTGLEIRQRICLRPEFSLIELSDAARKEPQARAEALNRADVSILCLPDEAARDAVALVENPAARVIDASSAHRVSEGWTFGFAEMEPVQYERIAAAKRVSNPGCYSTGFIALVRPLVREGLVPPDWPLSAAAVSGYSGGGRSMIEEFEDASSTRYVSTVVRTYALGLAHKHTPEMMKHAGLSRPPIFSPMVGRFYRGMLVDVPLPLWALPNRPTAKAVHSALKEAYLGRPLVEVAELGDGLSGGVLDVEALKNTNKMRLYVCANEARGQVRLIALLDNLGKGASGAAIQNLNIMLGLPEATGLI